MGKNFITLAKAWCDYYKNHPENGRDECGKGWVYAGKIGPNAQKQKDDPIKKISLIWFHDRKVLPLNKCQQELFDPLDFDKTFIYSYING